MDEARSDILGLGDVLEVEERAAALASEIDGARLALHQVAKRFRYLYFIWRRPFMVAGPDTFIDGLLTEAGGRNCAPRDRGRYPQLGIDEIERTDADVLLLSSEPFPFREAHRLELASRVSGDRVLLVDGELLSWHGVRMIEGLRYLGELARRF